MPFISGTNVWDDCTSRLNSFGAARIVEHVHTEGTISKELFLHLVGWLVQPCPDTLKTSRPDSAIRIPLFGSPTNPTSWNTANGTSRLFLCKHRNISLLEKLPHISLHHRI